MLCARFEQCSREVRGKEKGGGRARGGLNSFFCDQTCFCYSAEHSCMRVHVSKGKKLEKRFQKILLHFTNFKVEKIAFLLEIWKNVHPISFSFVQQKKVSRQSDMRMVLFIAAATFQLLRDCLTTPIQSCKTLRDKNR